MLVLYEDIYNYRADHEIYSVTSVLYSLHKDWKHEDVLVYIHKKEKMYWFMRDH